MILSSLNTALPPEFLPLLKELYLWNVVLDGRRRPCYGVAKTFVFQGGVTVLALVMLICQSELHQYQSCFKVWLDSLTVKTELNRMMKN